MFLTDAHRTGVSLDEAIRTRGLAVPLEWRDRYIRALKMLEDHRPAASAMAELLEEHRAVWGELVAWSSLEALPAAGFLEALVRWRERITLRLETVARTRVNLTMPVVSAIVGTAIPWIAMLSGRLAAGVPGSLASFSGSLLLGAAALFAVLAALARTARWLGRINRESVGVGGFLDAVGAGVASGLSARQAVQQASGALPAGRERPLLCDPDGLMDAGLLAAKTGVPAIQLAPLAAALADDSRTGSDPGLRELVTEALSAQTDALDRQAMGRLVVEGRSHEVLILASGAFSLACFVIAVFTLSFSR